MAPARSASVKLVGLDFGTTTSSAVVASTRLIRGATGRVDFDTLHECFRSEIVFTPLVGERLDEPRLEQLLDDWLAAGAVQPGEVFGGGALLTGLTARRDNAATLVRLVRRRLHNALIASADDPCLESWLAFMGSAVGLSRGSPERFVINLDIGGGTTNLALGRGGQVLSTGCVFVGARHIQVEPGDYRIVHVSSHGRALLDHLGIRADAGTQLTHDEVSAIVAAYLDMLELCLRPALLLPAPQRDAAPLLALHEQVPFRLPDEVTGPILTVSGGVGELVYAHLDGHAWPGTTCFGDLGIDLARGLVDRWGKWLRAARPTSAGRATVYGLLRHSTEVSGSTLFLPEPALLPLGAVPILGSLSAQDDDDRLRALLELTARSPVGGSIQLETNSASATDVARLGGRLAALLRAVSFPADRPLVILMRENLGKVLGQYATEWGRLPSRVIVIDEVSLRDAQYVQIGAAHDGVVPVSYFGFGS